MADLIDRQAAIDIVEFECGEWRGLAGTIVKAIEQLPSAQTDVVPVVRCEHCAHKKNCQWYYYSGDDYGFCNWAVREEHETES